MTSKAQAACLCVSVKALEDHLLASCASVTWFGRRPVLFHPEAWIPGLDWPSNLNTAPQKCAEWLVIKDSGALEHVAELLWGSNWCVGEKRGGAQEVTWHWLNSYMPTRHLGAQGSSSLLIVQASIIC